MKKQLSIKKTNEEFANIIEFISNIDTTITDVYGVSVIREPLKYTVTN